MAGFLMKQFPRIGLRYNNHYICCYNIQNSVRQSPLVLINNSSSEDKTNIAKNDVIFQRCHMTQISPTPFDTHSMVKELCSSGFSSSQAESLVNVLTQVAKYGSQEALAGQVNYKDMDLLELKMKGDVDSVRSSLLLLEKGAIAQLKDSTDVLGADTQRLKDMLMDEIQKVQSGVQLDINLERSRNKEHETLVEQKVKDAHNRIGTEVALLRTTIESQKLEMVKYLAGGIITIVTVMVSVVMGIWRLSK